MQRKIETLIIQRMKIKLFLAAVAMVLMTSCSKSSQPAQQDTELTPAQALLARIDTLMQHGYIYGHQDDPFYGIAWEWEEHRSDTYDLVGDYPGVMGFDLGGIEMGDLKNLDSVPFNRIHDEAIKHVERGGIVTFSWHPRNPRTGGTAWDVSDTLVVRNLLEGGDEHEKFGLWLSRLTTFFQSLQTEDGQPIPFIFRPLHEYNGSWFWWGQKLCSDDEFKALWNMIQDQINSQLSDNVVWAFSPNLQGGWTDEKFLARYPGNDRVDLIGEDAYQWGTEEDFTSAFAADLAYLSPFAANAGKPFAVTECGRVNSDIPDWWSRVFLPVLKPYNASYILPWRNWHTEHFGASKDASTAEDFKALCESHALLLLNDIK